MKTQWKERLSSALPDLVVVDDPASLLTYGRDWTRLYTPAPAAIAFPRDARQVLSLVRFARAQGMALVPSGGRTGLSGGAVAQDGEVVVSCDKLNQLGALDPIGRSVTVGAGVVTQRVQQYARQHGLFYPIDFAAKGSAQIGGNVATNAGGIRVLRYGLTRDWVMGLTVVTGRGELLKLNRGLVKNATGYDLRHLFVGSEGTLGIIADVTLALTDPPCDQAVMVLGVAEVEGLMRIFASARTGLTLSAFEFFSDLALTRVLARGALQPPFEQRTPYYALLEFDCANATHESAAVDLFESWYEAGYLVDGVISQSGAQAASLWRLREDISEAIAAETPYKNDISVPVSSVVRFLTELDAIVAEQYPDFEVVWFGHIGDGNLHLNVLKPSALAVAEFATLCERVNRLVFELVARHGGSISAEHGVGLLKRPYLSVSRSVEEIAYLRALKDVFDPDGILNPGKLLPNEPSDL